MAVLQWTSEPSGAFCIRGAKIIRSAPEPAMMMLFNLLLRTSIEDTVSKRPEANGRVVMGACPIVKMDF